jgi:hypothetical protein
MKFATIALYLYFTDVFCSDSVEGVFSSSYALTTHGDLYSVQLYFVF